MAKRREPRARYTVEEVYGSITSNSSCSDEDEDVGNSELQKENFLEGLSEEEPYVTVHNDHSSTPSGISKSLNAPRRLPIGSLSSKEMNNCPTVTEDQQALKDLTN